MKKRIVCLLTILLVIVSVFGLSSCKKNKNKNNGDNTPTTDTHHTHTLAHVDAKTKTCTEDGWAAYEYCTECTYTTKVIIPAGHVIANADDKAKTCTDDGWAAYEYCTECSHITKVVIPAGHVISNADAKTKTCTEDGWAAYEYCTECTYTTKAVIPAGHVIANADAKAKTCTEDGWAAYEYCTECNYTTKVVIPASHTIATAAAKTKTCTEDGWNAYEYCTECNYTTKVVIPASHTIANGTAKTKTCTEDGWNAYEYCTECSYTTKVVIPAGHTIANGTAKTKTCTEDGWEAYEYCTECNYTTKVVIPAGHVIANADAKAKTCTEDGWAAYEYCTECNYTTQVIDYATGHSLVNVDAKEPTCDDIGWEAYERCINCTYTTGIAIPPAHIIATAAAKTKTCTEDGWAAYEYCTECNYTTKVTIPAGHTIATAAAKTKTCTEDGWAAYEYCTECDYTTKVVIPSGHVIANVDAKEPTCDDIGWNPYEYCTECSHTTRVELPAVPHANVVVDYGYAATKGSLGLSDGSHCADCETVIVEQKTLYYLSIKYYNEEYGMVEEYSTSNAAGDVVYLHAYVDEVSGRGFSGWYVGKERLSDNLELYYTMPAHHVELTVCFTEYPNTDLWLGNTATAFSGGTGTADDPFIISSGAELKLLEQLVLNKEKYNKEYYTELHYLLVKSIDMSEGGEWTPIGIDDGIANSAKAFRGNFDGGDNVIYGLKLPARAESNCIGFFGYVVNATISDLTFVDVRANVTFRDLGYEKYYCGVVIGRAKTSVTIVNVEVHETSIHVSVTSDQLIKHTYVGGIAGCAGLNSDYVTHGVVFNGSIDVSTNTNTDVGGLFGNCSGLKSTLESSYVISDISVKSAGEVKVGGLFCDFSSISLYDCSYSGNISVDNSNVDSAESVYVGGLVGGNGSAYGKYLNMELCAFQGSIEVDTIGTVRVYGVSVAEVDTADGCVAEGSIDVTTVEKKTIYSDSFCNNPEKVEGTANMTSVTITENKIEPEED